jgi:hypothetical protein
MSIGNNTPSYKFRALVTVTACALVLVGTGLAEGFGRGGGHGGGHGGGGHFGGHGGGMRGGFHGEGHGGFSSGHSGRSTSAMNHERHDGGRERGRNERREPRRGDERESNRGRDHDHDRGWRSQRHVADSPNTFNRTQRWEQLSPANGPAIRMGGGLPYGGHRNGIPPANERRYASNEVVVELDGAPPPRFFDAMAARYGLTRLETQRVALTDTTWVRWRIADRRVVPAVVGALSSDTSVRWAQPNYFFDVEGGPATDGRAVDARDEAAEDSAQYALAKLHLPEAQALARGDRAVVAVLDTEIDRGNRELAGRIATSFDALGTAAPMEAHGTAIAGIIAAHARLVGAAPNVRILGVRAFGNGYGTTFSIVKGLDWAVAHDAKIVNMSFAGPDDPVLAHAIAAAYEKGIIIFAAVGNKGPASPPLYPAADPHVIAVTATNAQDGLYEMANRGSHVAIAAPGVDILVAAPENSYAMSSGTSFAAAYASGVAALLVSRKPDLTPDEAKRILMTTAHPLGPNGEFGAGLMDAGRALRAVVGQPAAQSSGAPMR